MFIVILRFSENKQLAAQFMDGHKEWLANGFNDGLFLLAGSLAGGAGGLVLADDVSEDDLRRRVDADPFVKEGVVTAEIVEFVPSKVHARLSGLMV